MRKTSVPHRSVYVLQKRTFAEIAIGDAAAIDRELSSEDFGINVARVIQELGGSAFAVYLSGGATGPVLDHLVRISGIESQRIPIAGHTRVSHTVHERSSNLEYRFVPEGPFVAPPEWQASLAALENVDCEYLVASGSLPRGVPADFYVQVAAVAACKGAKLVLDTSGDALRKATERGVYLIKPSLGELNDLIGRDMADASDQEAALRGLVESGAAEIVALTSHINAQSTACLNDASILLVGNPIVAAEITLPLITCG